jgi:GTP cyclohydrolase I
MTSPESAVDLGAAEDAVVRLLRAFRIDVSDPRLQRTPERVALSFAELFSGIGVDEFAPLRRGDAVPAGIDIVALRDLEFRSICAHHLLPFSGVAHIAYVPTTHLIGIGSIVRSLEVLSTRPQLQENLSQELAEALRVGANADGALVITEARHSCIADRGPREAASRMMSVAAVGVLREPTRRSEAMRVLHERL